MLKNIKKSDPEIALAIKSELVRQRNTINLIASENYTSLAVLEAAGSVLTNKYSEGYAGKRYYGGNEFIDKCETLAIERLKQLFDSPHANVQPHSGSQANFAVYAALLKPGDKILSMNLAHGGHLTHGSPVNFSGKNYHVIHYGVGEKTGKIDMDKVRETAENEKPKLIVTGASAYPREIDFRQFRKIADGCGALLMADIAHIAGLIAAGLHNSSVNQAHVTTSTTHKTLRGPRGGIIMASKELSSDIDKSVFPGTQGGPLDHIIAAKAVAFHEALQPDFKDYQKQIVRNSKALADKLMENDFSLVSGGTDNHLVLIDLSNKNISGLSAQNVLEKSGMIVNKNLVPYDKRKPMDPSGIRIGTPALTTRGMKENEMRFIGEWITKIIENPDDNTAAKARKEMHNLCEQFPLYPELDY